jgi:hypothetical protein
MSHLYLRFKAFKGYWGIQVGTLKTYASPNGGILRVGIGIDPDSRIEDIGGFVSEDILRSKLRSVVENITRARKLAENGGAGVVFRR